MKITLGKEGLKDTFQDDFPEEIHCCKCDGTARIGFVGIEEGGLGLPIIANLHPNEGKGGYWLHDCCVVAVYFCRNCLEPTALYNQA